MAEKTRFVFVSNYLNHHQIPFCKEMYRLLQGDFVFIQTEPMEEERLRMGWQKPEDIAFLRLFYEEPEVCRDMVLNAELVLFGGTDEEAYIEERLEAKKPVIRYSERLYKTGQWKAVSPRGLRKKYHDHTRHRNEAVYLLCAGAYVPSDFHIVRAYPDKMFCWGYFPETLRYDVDTLMNGKGAVNAAGERVPYLLWAARMIDWKHPDLPVKTAKYLKEKGLNFRMGIIGGGALAGKVESLVEEYALSDCVELLGFLSPKEVRGQMEQADIFLVTSDRQEGWGAVVNEAMNSGCAVVADHMIGAVPYLITHGRNGMVYRSGREKELYTLTEQLVRDESLRRELGRHAYETITGVWNAENAAQSLLRLSVRLGLTEAPDTLKETAQTKHFVTALSPCGPAPVISERKMYRFVHGTGTDQHHRTGL